MKKLFLPCVLYVLSTCSFAVAATINFEQFADSTQITTQYAGLTFTNAVQLTTANPSNDFVNFPAHSGTGVITNDPNETLTIAFATPQTGVSVFYTDFFPLTLTAFDSSLHLLGSVTGVSNIGSSSLLSLNLAGISILSFSDGSAIPDQFVLDDLTFGTGDSTGTPGDNNGGPGDGGIPVDVGVVPEPGTLVLVGSGLAGALNIARRRFNS